MGGVGVLQADVPGLREKLKSTMKDRKDSETNLSPSPVWPLGVLGGRHETWLLVFLLFLVLLGIQPRTLYVLVKSSTTEVQLSQACVFVLGSKAAGKHGAGEIAEGLNVETTTTRQRERDLTGNSGM